MLSRIGQFAAVTEHANLSEGCLANRPAGLFHSRCFAFNCVLVDEISSLSNSSLLHSKNSSSSDSSDSKSSENKSNLFVCCYSHAARQVHNQRTCESYLSPPRRRLPYFEIYARSPLASFSSRYNSSSSARRKRKNKRPNGICVCNRCCKHYIKYLVIHVPVTFDAASTCERNLGNQVRFWNER